MSPNSVNDLASSFVQMAKAFEELPGLQQALANAETMMSNQGIVIASREETILKLKSEIETLHAKVRTTEVERDDAEMRFLELDEKAGQVDAILRSIMVSAEHGKDLVAPKPEPQPVPSPIPEVVHSLDPMPSVVSSTGIISPSPLLVSDAQSMNSTSSSSETQPMESSTSPALMADHSVGQSEPLPTASAASSIPATTVSHGDPVGEVSESIATEDSRDPSPTSAPLAPIGTGTESEALGYSRLDKGPYTDRNYYDVPGFVSRSDWLAGGGTDESYDYRPF